MVAKVVSVGVQPSRMTDQAAVTSALRRQPGVTRPATGQRSGIAFAVFLEGGGVGGRAAAPVAAPFAAGL